MKNITLQTVTENGNLIEESQLQISEGDKLIVIVPEDATESQCVNLHRIVKETLEGDKLKVLTIPNGVKLQVLSIK